MSINPILDLLYDGQGKLKTQITDRDLEEFNYNHVEPKSDLVRGIHRQPRHNPDPARADSRNILMHLWDKHRNGHTPLGDLVLLSNRECEGIHFPIINQTLRYFNDATQRFNDATKRNVSFCMQDETFLRMALLYEVLPYVGQRLKLSISSEELSQKIKNTFESFQQKVNPFNQPNSRYDTGIFALGCMNKAVFGMAVVTAPDGSRFSPKFQFGPKNDGKNIKAIQLLEAAFQCYINQVPLEKEPTHPDNIIKYLEYGGSGPSSADAKIDLFVKGADLASVVRQIVTEQHSLMYSDDPHLKKIATLSNDSFGPDKLLAFLASNTQNG